MHRVLFLWSTLLYLAQSLSVNAPHWYSMTGLTTQRPPMTAHTSLSNRRFLNSASNDEEMPANNYEEEQEEDDSLQQIPKNRSLATKIKDYFRGPQDGLTFKQRLAKYGLAAVLSYGAVSNVGGCTAVSIAWYIFSKRNLVSPLAPGQLKSFLAVYAGFFVFLNVIRPVRFAFAIAISPQFDRLINFLQGRFSLSRTSAIVATVFLVNVLGSIAVLVTGVSLASLASGVPIYPLATP